MKEQKRNYVVCIRADEASDLEVRKIYQVLADESAAKRGHVRVVDESGEDYLYPEEYFVRIPMIVNTSSGIVNAVSGDGEHSSERSDD